MLDVVKLFMKFVCAGWTEGILINYEPPLTYLSKGESSEGGEKMQICTRIFT